MLFLGKNVPVNSFAFYHKGANNMRIALFVLTLFYSTVLSAQKNSVDEITMMNDVSASYLQRLIEIGRNYYPKFRLTTAKANAAKAAYDKSKWGVLDFIALSYIYYPGNEFSVYSSSGANSSYLNGYQLGLFVNVGTMLQKPSVIKGAKQEYIAAKMDKEATDDDLEQEIRKRYYTYVEMSNILKLKASATTDADDVLKHVKYKFEKGEVTFENYNQALLSFSTYSQEKITAESALLIAKSNLEEMLGTKLENIK
jgi:outer membrane protein TolC